MRSLFPCCVAIALTGSALAIDIDPDWSIARTWDEEQLFAIRLSTPRPPVHARNLYHVAAGMYDAWAVYDKTAHGSFVFEKHTARDVDAARREAISYAAYRILKARYVAGNGPNIAQIQADFDQTFADLGYDKNVTTTRGNSPAAIGNRIAATILAQSLNDGANESGNYAPTDGYAPINESMPFKIPGTVMEDPSHWQPLAFDFLVLQNGEIIGAAEQVVVCPHWRLVTPFAMNEFDRNLANECYFDQGPPPQMGTEEMREQGIAMLAHSAVLDPSDGETIDISPATYHNSPLGTYDQPGYGLNPVTGEPYPPNVVVAADYFRINAEFWADGPDSETPPGHWHVVGNNVSDYEGFSFKLFGEGEPLDRLQWDVKMYLAIAGAVHDSAVTAWGMKGYYDSARPISFVRYMGQSGQSSDPKLPSYDPNGLPLVEGLTRIVQPEDVLPGGEFEDLAELVYNPIIGEPIGVNTHVGDIVVRSWLGGFSAGTTTGQITTGPIPGHIYRTDGGWNIGAWDLGVDDTPGAVNPGLSLPASLEIAELRNAQQGADLDEYVEIAGQPGTSLDNVWFIVIGDEVQTGVPDSQGRVQTAVDLTGHTLDENGLFLVGRSTLSLATPDLVNLLNFKEIGNVTYALVTNFSGYPGLDLDIFDNGNIDIPVWSSVLDAIALRRNGNPQGVYLGAPTLGPVASKTQTYGVGWQLADRWMTYQASNFVTPPFPGYVSGHSTFSRAAAEALTGITGSPYFPGGLFNYTIPADWLKFEFGPSKEVTFQWVTYYDAADEAGESRIWGGIHPPADDLPARIAGDEIGKRVVERVKALYSGEYLSPDINGDGVVDGADLGLLLGQWGGKGGFADLNGDGLVDGADLGLLLGDWG